MNPNDTPKNEPSEDTQALEDIDLQNIENSTTDPTPIGGPAIVPQKKKSKKIIVTVAFVLLVSGITTVGYFVGQSLQQAVAPSTSEVEGEAPVDPVETPSDIENEIQTIQDDIDAVSDEDFSEDPVADESLNAAE